MTTSFSAYKKYLCYILPYVSLLNVYRQYLIQKKNNYPGMLHQDRDKSQYSDIEPLNFAEKTSFVHLHLEEEEECKSYASRPLSTFDRMLKNSFVETDRVKKKCTKEIVNSYENSGQSFFTRTNNLYFSQIGKKEISKKKHKLLQCEIGTGVYFIQQTKNALDKARRLQILKIIKLIKVLFKFLRLNKQKIEQSLEEEREKNAILFSTLKFQLNHLGKYFQSVINDKNMKIYQIQQENIRLSELYEKLNNKVQVDLRDGKNEMKEIYQQHYKKMQDLAKELQQMHSKNEELYEKNNQLENVVHSLEIQLSNAHHTNENNDIFIKKLQYQSKKMQQETKELAYKLQNALQANYQHQDSLEQEDELFLSNYQELKEIKSLNQLYLKEIQLTKKQLFLTQQNYHKLQVEKEETMNYQLSKYQEYFNSQIEKMKRQMCEQLHKKDKLIQKMREQQKLYLNILYKNQLHSEQLTSDHHKKSANISSFAEVILSKTNHISTNNSNNFSNKDNNNQSKLSVLENYSDPFVSPQKCFQSKLSQKKGHNTKFSSTFFDFKGEELTNGGMMFRNRQYDTFTDGFRLKQGFSGKAKSVLADSNDSHQSKWLFNQKLNKIENKLIKLNKSLDYKITQSPY